MSVAARGADDDYNFDVDDPPPPMTLTRNICFKCCHCYIVTSQLSDCRYWFRYCGYRKLGLGHFLASYTILCYYLYFAVRYILPLDDSQHKFASWIFLLAWFSTAINFLLVHEIDPGYLPWTWNETQRDRYSCQELQQGVATRMEQIEWAKEHKYPARALLSKKYGWFVLRADHDCLWVDSFIGIRNHRYFVRAVYSGAILTIVGIGLAVRVAYIGTLEVSAFWFVAMQLVVMLLGSFCFGQVYHQTVGLTMNVLTVESMKKVWSGRVNPYRRDCLSNWEEVCGPRKYLPCWILPITLPGSFDGMYDFDEAESFL